MKYIDNVLNIYEEETKNDNKIDEKLKKISEFDQLGLNEYLLKGVINRGYNKPSRIQEYALPIIIGTKEKKPCNIIGQAKSGSGKTAAFVLGMLSHVDVKINRMQGLIGFFFFFCCIKN